MLVLVLAVNAGLFYFSYLPHRTASPAGSLPEQTERTALAAPPEKTTLDKTTLDKTTLDKTTLDKTTLESTTATATATATATSTVSP